MKCNGFQSWILLAGFPPALQNGIDTAKGRVHPSSGKVEFTVRRAQRWAERHIGDRTGGVAQMFYQKILSTFRVIWERVGASERFKHFVIAETAAQARYNSSIEIASALGPNAEVWEIVDVVEVTMADASEAAAHLQ
jgi:hypothetical protein